MTKKFWNLKAASKLDQLCEGRFNHNDVILACLSDSETRIERVDRITYTLYGDEEALLVQPISLHFRIGLFVYHLVLTFLNR